MLQNIVQYATYASKTWVQVTTVYRWRAQTAVQDDEALSDCSAHMIEAALKRLIIKQSC